MANEMTTYRTVPFWHKALWQHLESLRGESKLPSALLFHHIQGFGLEHFVMRLAQAILCQSEGDNKPCNECKACGYWRVRNHPDFLCLKPSGAANLIKIDDAHAMREHLQTTGYYGGKVVVILDAERLNNAAANAILKTLEEPPEGATILLACHFPSLLPPTVRSRCRMMHFDSPPENKLIEWLADESGAGQKQCKQALINADGHPMDALAMLTAGSTNADVDGDEPCARVAFLDDLDNYLAGKASPTAMSDKWSKTSVNLVHGWLLGRVSREIRSQLDKGQLDKGNGSSLDGIQLLYKLYDKQAKRCHPNAERFSSFLLLNSALHEMHFAFRHI